MSPIAKLTAKQEKFVQSLVSGLSQRKAYLEAYPNSNNWTERTVDSRASELLKKSNVLGRYNELMDEHKAKALWTREEAINKLKWLMSKAESSIDIQDEGYVRQGTSTAFVNTIQELNKLEGLYPSEKQEIELSGGVQFVDDI